MDVILSIKPKYVEKIITGEKQYEFRRTIFKRKHIRKAYIYSSSPTKKIIGSFIIGDIIEGHPERLWDELSTVSGLSEHEFFDYFVDKEKGFAIKIGQLHLLNDPLEPQILVPDFTPPQSFSYIDQTNEIS
jgi:type I restriction enzyme S subunit